MVAIYGILTGKHKLRRQIKMGLWELFVIAVGLSMDAFAVAVCKGLSLQKIKINPKINAPQHPAPILQVR